tara:strand:+ start:56002 stop:57063 length:1062 start_codon:yes stop_codon:yes gene_type:complete
MSDAGEMTAELPVSPQDCPFVDVRHASRRFERRMSPVAAFLARLGLDYADEIVHAVDDVSLRIGKGSVLGLVGESGCGKSTLGRLIASLLPVSDGEVRIDGHRMASKAEPLSRRELLRTQMVFQNPMASLNPRQKIVDILTEGPIYHGLIKRRDKNEFAAALLLEVGLPQDILSRLPHQFSGGQRQRIGIARALSVSPDFLICDEPVAALDVSIQAQIINLLLDLKEKRALTILFISHDLGVVRHLCDQVAVMYLGRIVEMAPTEALFSNPVHPYTKALFEEIPRIRGGHREYQPIKGEIPSPLSPPPGCHFHPRCPRAIASCSSWAPPQSVVGDGHSVSCWLNAPADPTRRN